MIVFVVISIIIIIITMYLFHLVYGPEGAGQIGKKEEKNNKKSLLTATRTLLLFIIIKYDNNFLLPFAKWGTRIIIQYNIFHSLHLFLTSIEYFLRIIQTLILLTIIIVRLRRNFVIGIVHLLEEVATRRSSWSPPSSPPSIRGG